jgi:hypothetical protein
MSYTGLLVMKLNVMARTPIYPRATGRDSERHTKRLSVNVKQTSLNDILGPSRLGVLYLYAMG